MWNKCQLSYFFNKQSLYHYKTIYLFLAICIYQ